MNTKRVVAPLGLVLLVLVVVFISCSVSSGFSFICRASRFTSIYFLLLISFFFLLFYSYSILSLFSSFFNRYASCNSPVLFFFLYLFSFLLFSSSLSDTSPLPSLHLSFSSFLLHLSFYNFYFYLFSLIASSYSLSLVCFASILLFSLFSSFSIYFWISCLNDSFLSFLVLFLLYSSALYFHSYLFPQLFSSFGTSLFFPSIFFLSW